jgi:aspartate/methionine/tyrosine aminotransferase
MFSRRTRWSLEPNQLTTRLQLRRAAGGEVLDLTEANPTRAGLGWPGAALAEALADPQVASYQPSPRGLPAARAAVAAYYQRRGVAMDPDHLVLCASTSEAYSFVFKLLADPGDAVLVPRPSYPLFEFLATLESLVVRSYPLACEGRWRIDTAALAAGCTADVRAIVVVSPNNPTGSFLSQPELAALRALGRPLVADEVFGDYALGEDPTRVGTLAASREGLSFTLSGLSKLAGLPQLKLGWIAVAGEPALVGRALERLDVIADTYLSVGTPVQLATPRLLEQAPAQKARIQERVEGNRAVLARTLGPESAARALPADGGWYAVVRLPRTRSEEAWVLELLERDGVLTHPGYFFDFDEEAYLVLSLLPEPAVFAEAAARLARRVDG